MTIKGFSSFLKGKFSTAKREPQKIEASEASAEASPDLHEFSIETSSTLHEGSAKDITLLPDSNEVVSPYPCSAEDITLPQAMPSCTNEDVDLPPISTKDITLPLAPLRKSLC